MKNSTAILEHRGIKPTPNRILVLNALLSATHPMSLVDIDTAIGTMDRSSVFRVLNLFQKFAVVHTIEDGSGSLKYEICHSEHHCSIDDMHIHFYCEKCHQTYCFESISIPQVHLPAGFHTNSINYVVKGVCPSCRESNI